MRALVLLNLTCCIVLTGCLESSPQLSKEDEKLFDAVMYAFTGIEDNTKDSHGLTPWKKEPTAKGFRFSMIGKNSIVSSDSESNKRLRQSKYVQYVYRLTSRDRCVFRFEDCSEFSKGGSEREFARMPGDGNDLLNSHTFGFSNAHKFEFEDDGWGTFVIVLEGPKVRCSEEHRYCENKWTSELSGMALDRFRSMEKLEVKRRRGRAIEVIKAACPARAF